MMAWVEGALRPVYPVKSALKIAVFLGGAALYAWASGVMDTWYRAKARAEKL